MSEIPKASERGKLGWRLLFHGMNGGVIQLLVNKNRTNFKKRIIFNKDEELELAVKVLRDRKETILRLKDRHHPEVARIAQYAIDATEITELQDEEKGSRA